MAIKGGCGRPECCASTGIHDPETSKLSGLTFGAGRIDQFGYWEFPCKSCARAFEELHPEATPCWPFQNMDLTDYSATFTTGLEDFYGDSDKFDEN